jgi:hypothetical protein
VVFCDAQTDMPLAEASGAICVQRFDDSRNSAIHITYRISLRSSSMQEPRYPSLRVVLFEIRRSTKTSLGRGRGAPRPAKGVSGVGRMAVVGHVDLLQSVRGSPGGSSRLQSLSSTRRSGVGSPPGVRDSPGSLPSAPPDGRTQFAGLLRAQTLGRRPSLDARSPYAIAEHSLRRVSLSRGPFRTGTPFSFAPWVSSG